MPKTDSPLNCRELLPTEKYWALVKRKLFETKKKANGTDDFKRRWRIVTAGVSEDTAWNLIAGIPQKTREFYRKKVYHLNQLFLMYILLYYFEINN